MRNRLNEYFGKKYPARFTPDAVSYYEDSPEELAVINYTSGSTGFSKGVMLPYRSLWSNVKFCLDHLPFLSAGDGIVCMLPMAHMYGMVIEMIHPFLKGCHLHFLTRIPSPKIIMDAFATVKPKLIYSRSSHHRKNYQNQSVSFIRETFDETSFKSSILRHSVIGKNQR